MATQGEPSQAKTTIDSLAELLKQKGKMELSKIAAALGVEQNIVENWSKVLEEGNLVKITYEVGKMYVEPKTVTKEQEQALAATVDAERVKLENDLALQRTSLDKFATRLEAISLSVKSAENLFQQKFPELEVQLQGINKIYTALESENEKIDTIRKGAENTYENINKKISSLYGKVEGVDSNTAQGARDELQKVHDILKKAEELENQLALLSKSKDKAIESIRKSIEEQLKLFEKELAQAERNIAAQLKTDESQIQQSFKSIKELAKNIDETSKQVSSFRREKEAAKKALTDTKSAFNDEYARITSRMDSTSDALKAQINSMLKDLDTLKASFGEMGKMFSTLQKAKIEIDAIQRKIAELRAQADKLNDEVRVLATMKGSTEAKARATQNVETKVTALTDAGKRLDDQIGKLSKGLDE